MPRRLWVALLAALIAMAGLAGTVAVQAAQPVAHQGRLTDGALWTAEAPREWNGTLVLWSHGYRAPGSPNPAVDAPSAAARNWLLGHRYALAGSSYARTGWVAAQAVTDQMAVIDVFSKLAGRPQTVIAWGQSMGGLVTVLLVQEHGDRIAGGLAMCGVVGGTSSFWGDLASGAAAFRHLIGKPGSGSQAGAMVGAAQRTPLGRAALAQVAAAAGVPEITPLWLTFAFDQLQAASGPDPDGTLSAPLLSVYDAQDPLVGAGEEAAFAARVARTGNSKLLARTALPGSEHCQFTHEETIAAFQIIAARIATGAWPPIRLG